MIARREQPAWVLHPSGGYKYFVDELSLRSRLEDLHKRAEDRVAALAREVAEVVESAQLANIDDEHDPEGSTIAYERANVLALLAAARNELDATEAALRRVDDATYGMCVACGRHVGHERLDALPTTGVCIECAA